MRSIILFGFLCCLVAFQAERSSAAATLQRAIPASLNVDESSSRDPHPHDCFHETQESEIDEQDQAIVDLLILNEDDEIIKLVFGEDDGDDVSDKDISVGIFDKVKDYIVGKLTDEVTDLIKRIAEIGPKAAGRELAERVKARLRKIRDTAEKIANKLGKGKIGKAAKSLVRKIDEAIAKIDKIISPNFFSIAEGNEEGSDSFHDILMELTVHEKETLLAAGDDDLETRVMEGLE